MELSLITKQPTILSVISCTQIFLMIIIIYGYTGIIQRARDIYYWLTIWRQYHYCIDEQGWATRYSWRENSARGKYGICILCDHRARKVIDEVCRNKANSANKGYYLKIIATHYGRLRIVKDVAFYISSRDGINNKCFHLTNEELTKIEKAIRRFPSSKHNLIYEEAELYHKVNPIIEREYYYF